ncbi:MAG: c-type cytochrome [Vicinamibacteria bacterium]
MRRLLGTIAVLVLAGSAVSMSLDRYRSRNLGAVQRGYRIADRTGCFTCHGPGGHRGMPDPGHGLEDVPPWSGGILATYADSEAEIRQWIVDGLPESVRKDPEQMKLRARAVIRMPAFGEILSEAEVSDLVAYVEAVGDFEKPKDGRAEEGRQVALRFGCFNCHGPQGRGALSNARSLKGYVPSWDGADFTELARDDQEIRDWVFDGGTRRVVSSLMARFFLERQPVKMPAYRGYVTDDEAARLVDYIHWLRLHPY